MTLLVAKDIGIQVGKRWLYKHVNFKLEEKNFLTIVGDNGVGKTTLIKAILGQQELSSGNFEWNTKNHKIPKIRYVPQYRPDVQAYPLYIKDFVALSFDHGFRPWLSKNEKKKLNDILINIGIDDISHRTIDTASGGERQKAYLAQALVQKPEILILDEATANLDNSAKYDLMNVVKKYSKEYGITVIMISHDFDIISKYTDNYLLLTPTKSEYDKINEDNLYRLKERYNTNV